MVKAHLFRDVVIECSLDSKHVESFYAALQQDRLVNPLLDDSLSDSTDDQLKRLISLKFNNDSYKLIRQLFRDLSAKETELILLREEKARRENELLRLCNEFGNLSYVEIDKRLNSLESVKDVHKVVSNLVQEAVTSINKDNSNADDTKASSKNIKIKQPSNSEIGSGILQPETSLRSEKSRTGPTDSILPQVQEYTRQQVSWSHWLHWFNLSDDNLLRLAISTKDFENSKSSANMQKTKMVVELDNIIDSCSPELPGSLSETDKFGFLKNRSSIIERPPSNASSSTIHDQMNDQTPSTTQFASEKSLFKTSLILGKVESPSRSTLSSTAFTQSLDILKHLETQSIASIEMQLNKWDLFMKKLCNTRSPASDQDVSLGAFGLKAINLKQQSSTLRKVFSQADDRLEDSKFFKSLRKLVFEIGIPPKYRNLLWFELSGAKNRAVAGEYQRLIHESNNSADPKLTESIEQIKLDLHRTLPSNIYFCNITKEPGPQISTLNNILMAFVAYKPEVGYCQGMNKLAGNLILGINESHAQGGAKLNEEYLFWLYVSIIEDILPSYDQFRLFHPEALKLIKCDSEKLRKGLKKFLPLLAKHLESLSIEIEIIVISWWIGVFSEAVSSLDIWFKILDGLLIADDPRIMFHGYTLAMLKFYLRSLLDCTAAESVYLFINQLKNGNGPNIRSNEFMATAAEFEDLLVASSASSLLKSN